MAIINQQTREETTSDPMFQEIMRMSPEQRKQLRAQLTQSRPNTTGDRVGAGLGTAANIFGQMGGLKIAEPEKNDINSLMMREYVKNMYKEKPVIPENEELPEGLWRDPVSNKIVKLPSTLSKEKFDLKQEEDKKRKESIAENIKSQARDSLSMIDEAKRGINYFGAGSLMPAIPTLQGKKTLWQSNIDRLLSTRVLDLMNQMKAASRTGATGFGQLNKSELDLLKNASTTLKKTLSPDDALRYLTQMENMYRKIAGEDSGDMGGENIPTRTGQNNDPLGIR